MAKKAKVSYDEENDILWVHTGEKVKDSLEVDSFIIDFSPSDKVVGVEIMNASEVISNLAQSNVTKEALSGIQEAQISFYQGRELFYIVIGLALKVNGQIKEISLQVPSPSVAISI